MTREEAHKQLYSAWSDEINYSVRPKDILDKVYDDFESGTCENCKWYKNVGESYRVCLLYDIAYGKDFGCNKFKLKEIK